MENEENLAIVHFGYHAYTIPVNKVGSLMECFLSSSCKRVNLDYKGNIEEVNDLANKDFQIGFISKQKFNEALLKNNLAGK